ncbi:VOC family protein [Nocardioides sp. P86]|uniref:VOC family protein n=1 Tax=Nocardioides sp. P86 TaxID=2939569 RepID=UPI00203FD901|nr:VOC family protein [Nocardioides sp. P86]MCM3514734.1 glyoxalase [Nocardioides sp. P86]
MSARLHHVQVSCPPGGEDDARRLWVGALGLVEVEKPPALRARGGAWFRSYDEQGRVVAEVHVGAEADMVPARRAHPALLLDDEAALEGAADRVAALGLEVDRSERGTFPGYLRLHVRDAAGNRVELLAPGPD